MLDFVDDGRPCAKHPDQTIRNQRAIESIKAYHLDHPELVEERRQLALDITRWVRSANKLYETLDESDPEKKTLYTETVENIGKAIASDARFSVFAKKIVKGFSQYPWIEDILDCA